MAKLKAVYYRAQNGSEPVDEFIDRLTLKRQVVIDNQIDRLNMLTTNQPHLPFPHSSQIEGELRELRCHYGPELYRVLYRRSKNLILLLHMFRKDTERSPKRRSRPRTPAGKTSRGGWTLSAAGRRGLLATMRPSLTFLSILISYESHEEPPVPHRRFGC
jgi:phage-related protein